VSNLDWDDEIWDGDDPCPRCGHYYTSYRKCEYCDDGIVDDLYEEDPLWYDPGDWEYCQHCHGKGYYSWCRNCGWDLVEQRFINQSNLPVKEFALKRPFSFLLLQSRPVPQNHVPHERINA
jgi:hypothetical protein